MSKKTRVGVVIAGLAIALIAAISFLARARDAGKTPTSPVQTADAIRVGYPILRIGLPVFVANERGFFADQGLDVELQRYETAQPMMDALVGGSIDIAGYTALPITFSAMARSQVPLLFMTAMIEDDAHPISMIIVRKSSNINDVKDLAGKRIGILPTRAYEAWLNELLRKNGVEPSAVVIQQIPPPQQAAALASGSVDALFTNDPAATAAIAGGHGRPLGTKAVVPHATEINPFYFGSFNVRRDYAEANPDVVRRLSIALDSAIIYIRTNPDSALVDLAKYLPPEQRNLVRRFPPSSYRLTDDVQQAYLDSLLQYYKKMEVVPAALTLTGAQYHR